MAGMGSGATPGLLARLFREGSLAGAPDEELLSRFVARRDGPAFAALVERYGPMVLRTTSAILRDPHDAEDAFQATFLVLARKAGSVGGRGTLAGWLYRVARRIALRAAADAARRRETRGGEMNAIATEDRRPDDVLPLLHEELGRLPEKYRAPVVLCYLEELSYDEAASRLRWTEGMVRGRLARARDLLRGRLARRGVAAPAAALAAALAPRPGEAAAVAALARGSVEAATRVAAGGTAAGGIVSIRAAALAEGAMRSMIFDKLGRGAAVVLAVGILAGAGALTLRAAAAARPTTTAAAAPGDDGEELTPVELLAQVRDHYRGLDSFAMRIEHRDSSGLYPGGYTQELRWRKGDRFTLKVVSRGNETVPDFHANGLELMRLGPDGSSESEAIRPESGSSPDWEVSGGLILSWLQDTPMGRMILDPGSGLGIRWVYGPRTEWRSHPVREVVMTIADPGDPDGRGTEASLFVDPVGRRLIGVEANVTGRPGWAVYADQRENPAAPDGLLDAGVMAPDFSLEAIDGGRAELGPMLRGRKALLINFWFAGCGPCREEFPHLQRLYEECKDRGLAVLAINCGDTAGEIRPFLEEHGLTFPVALAGEGAEDVSRRYGVHGFPTTYILRPDGRVAARETGFSGPDTLESIRATLASLGVESADRPAERR